MSLAVAVLGLGEAGGSVASGLAAAGCEVRGWDPDETRAAAGVERAASPTEAVVGAGLVLSLATAAHALDAATSVAPALGAPQLYADLNTTAPILKREVAAVVEPTGAAFADVALLGGVPAGGIRTPALASGGGAERFAELVRPLGMPVELVAGGPGEAAGRKLLRSVFMKSLATTVLEALGAGRTAGAEEWVRKQIIAELDSGGAGLVERLVDGTYRHSRRRAHEMRDARDYLAELGAPSEMTSASLAWLSAIDAGAR